jgi:hypothetical protein
LLDILPKQLNSLFGRSSFEPVVAPPSAMFIGHPNIGHVQLEGVQ